MNKIKLNSLNIIKLNNMHFYKTLKGQVKSARGKVVETQEDFMIDKIKEFLSFRIGDVEGVFAMLSETYLNSVMNKTQPASLAAAGVLSNMILLVRLLID